MLELIWQLPNQRYVFLYYSASLTKANIVFLAFSWPLCANNMGPWWNPIRESRHPNLGRLSISLHPKRRGSYDNHPTQQEKGPQVSLHLVIIQ